MSGGREPVKATFWLLEAPDSLAQQSRREPDGTGLGTFTADACPVVRKQPLAAYEDQQFAREAREAESRTFVAHVRHASTGEVSMNNTHPFEQDGRLFAHNGVLGDLGALEEQLGDARGLVHGETDSERFFALITKQIDETQDVAEGIASGARWIAEHLPVFSLNLVLITNCDLYALRYPDTNELHVLEREAGGTNQRRHLDHASARGSIRVRSASFSNRPAVIVATEMMDESPGWRALQAGELLHVDEDLNTTITTVIDEPPKHQLTLEDLEPHAAASQQPTERG